MAQVELLSWWNFDTPLQYGVTIDAQAGRPANVLGGAIQTADGGGHTATGNDRAMTFGTGAQRLRVADASYFAAVEPGNAVSISLWQKLNTIRSATVFSAVSPSVGGRGIQTHAPWSDSNIYWDTAGCCNAGEHRSSGPVPFDWVSTDWNHWVFIKNGDEKLVYVNGVLTVSGSDFQPLPADYTEFFIGNAPNLGEAVDGSIDDVAVYSGALSEAQVLSLAAGALPSSVVPGNDADGDTLPDAWEYRFFPGDLTKLSLGGDRDADGLKDEDELARGTSPAQADTDGDGLTDGAETNTGTWVGPANTGTSPVVADTDGDGLLDGVETNTGTFVSAANTGTNPLLADTDADLVNDGLEILYGSSPVNVASTPVVPGVPTLLAFWDFNDPSDPAKSVDLRIGLEAATASGAAYTAEAEGHTAQAGDYAMNFPSGGARLDVSKPVINLGARVDKVTISFWQRKASTPDSSAFWATSPSSSGVQRGLQAHVPWSNGNIYFDSAGCCDGNQRINGVPTDAGHDWSTWHHYVFVKNGGTKQVWIDGILNLSGTGAAPLPTDFTTLRIGCDNGAASIDGDIDDFAIFAAALSADDIARLASGTSPLAISSSADADADGLTDAWEYLFFPSDLTKLSAAGDYDNDGLTDGAELLADTDPTDDDTDDDGLKDGVETKTGTWVDAAHTGTDPKSADTDKDGLSDGVETNTGIYVSAANTGSNPLLKDSDADGFPDGVELLYTTSPVSAASRPFTPGETTLLAWWPFNDDSDPAIVTDVVHGFTGEFTGGAFYAADGEGRTAAAGDKAASIFTSASITVAAGGFLNAAAPDDSITISYWQKLSSTDSSSGFWGNSPASLGGRGIQAHSPWGDGNIYFDHGGCCTGGVDRISGPFPGEVDAFSWAHIAFIKNGNEKQVWINGALALSGASAVALPSDFDVLYIGSGPNYSPPSMNGLMDDFAVYAGALTEAQIMRLALGESPDTITGVPPVGAPIAITSITRAGNGSITITWTSEDGVPYTVEGSSNLSTWSTVQAGLTGAVGSTSHTIVNPPASPYFLRVRR